MRSAGPVTCTEYVLLITHEKSNYIAFRLLSSRHPIFHAHMLHLLYLISRNQKTRRAARLAHLSTEQHARSHMLL